MKKTFCVNFLLGSILLIILFFNLAVISVDMTFGDERRDNYIAYMIMSVIDIAYLTVIIIINHKLIKSIGRGIKYIIIDCIIPLLLPTLVAILIISIKGVFENNPHPTIRK